jgi:hypothetical protein
MNKTKAVIAKRRAANVEADAQAVAAAVATGPSCVPRSPEAKAELKGSRHQVLDEADKQHAAGMAKYEHMLKELVPLYKKDPSGFDKKLKESFSAEEAAKVRKLVRQARNEPSFAG